MAVVRRPIHSLYWDETECLNYYGMQSLHEVYEVVGSQLTETDVEVLSFLLDETHQGFHPLDPAGWTPEFWDESANGGGDTQPAPKLLQAWQRVQPRGSTLPTTAQHIPKSGVELLLELERRGYLSESRLGPLLQLLRILTRHDLLAFVSCKKRRVVSPERVTAPPVVDCQQEGVLTSSSDKVGGERQTPSTCTQEQWRADPSISSLRRQWQGRRRRGGRMSGAPRGRTEELQEIPPRQQDRVTCDIRLRVRAEYSDPEAALRGGGVWSARLQPLERQFDLFSRAIYVLRARDLGAVVCDIKFSELSYLDAFWADYLSGALGAALRGVFLTDALRRAVGSQAVRLLVSVDQDDYEEGRRLLLQGLAVADRGEGGRRIPPPTPPTSFSSSSSSSVSLRSAAAHAVPALCHSHSSS
ncbi:death effector domain-containing 1 isoform X2 [Amia ocellicauda]|uniref:death effector domain-containing 1 isoform X2 n=1 Tax=Amia ocellicauda TaxID=2972642 RepID=UPI003464A419